MNFGAKVKDLRLKLQLTQGELAQRLGVTPKTISNYESRNLRPRTMEMYQSLADSLEVNINYLLTEQDYFILNATDEFGKKGAIDAQKIVDSLAGLFAGGSLPEEDKDALFDSIQEAYWEAKIENKKYSKKARLNE